MRKWLAFHSESYFALFDTNHEGLLYCLEWSKPLSNTQVFFFLSRPDGTCGSISCAEEWKCFGRAVSGKLITLFYSAMYLSIWAIFRPHYLVQYLIYVLSKLFTHPVPFCLEACPDNQDRKLTSSTYIFVGLFPQIDWNRLLTCWRVTLLSGMESYVYMTYSEADFLSLGLSMMSRLLTWEQILCVLKPKSTLMAERWQGCMWRRWT